MKQLSLSSIFGWLTATVVGLSALAAAAAFQSARCGQQVEDASARRVQSIRLAAELRQSSDDLTRLARTYVVTGDPRWERQYLEVLDIRNGKRPRPEGYERIYWDFRAADDAYQRPAGAAQPLQQAMKAAGFTDEEFRRLADAQANSDDLVRTETVAMNLVKGRHDDGKGGFTREGPPELEKARAMMHDADYHRFKAKIMQPVDDFLRLLDERTASEVAQLEARRHRWAVVAEAALLLLAVAVSAALVWGRRQVMAIFRDARAVAARIAACDLSQPVARRGDDEAGQLIAALDTMQANLRRVIGEVRAGSESIASGSSQIATGSSDLSQRTESQAGSLQQTAASMAELTGAVRQNAESAGEAARIADGASQAAAHGGTLVQRVVSTMAEINASSQRITEIIGTIDAIAFQTNILALNAAVEAARAGEQGRGFAVVAGAVRTLAPRSAEAAREIKSLIGASREKVETGEALVGDAGHAMEDIVARVQLVSALIADISRSTSEQHGGIGPVGAGVAQLDGVTQQNAALVEQSAAAAESLQQQAARLASAVQVFRLGPGTAAA